MEHHGLIVGRFFRTCLETWPIISIGYLFLECPPLPHMLGVIISVILTPVMALKAQNYVYGSYGEVTDMIILFDYF